MKRIVLAVLAAGVLSLGAITGTAAAAPSANSCHGQIISTAAQNGGGIKTVADQLFGEGPHSVQTGQRFVDQVYCG